MGHVVAYTIGPPLNAEPGYSVEWVAAADCEWGHWLRQPGRVTFDKSLYLKQDPSQLYLEYDSLISCH